MFCWPQGHLIPGAYKFDALITTFEMVLSDCPELREIAWRCVIIDEAHRLKNRNCKLLDSLKMLDLVSAQSPPCWGSNEPMASLLGMTRANHSPPKGSIKRISAAHGQACAVIRCTLSDRSILIGCILAEVIK